MSLNSGSQSVLDIWGQASFPCKHTWSRGCSKPGSRAGWPQSLGQVLVPGPGLGLPGMLGVRLLPGSEPSQSAENTSEGGKHHGRAAERTGCFFEDALETQGECCGLFSEKDQMPLSEWMKQFSHSKSLSLSCWRSQSPKAANVFISVYSAKCWDLKPRTIFFEDEKHMFPNIRTKLVTFREKSAQLHDYLGNSCWDRDVETGGINPKEIHANLGNSEVAPKNPWFV